MIERGKYLRNVGRISAMVTMAASTACGGGTNPAAPSAPYLWQISDAVPPRGATRQLLSIPRGGTMTLDVNWGNVGTDLDLYLTSHACQANPVSECEILARSEQKGPPLREHITFAVTQGQQLAAWITSDATFAVTYQLRQQIE